MQEEAKPDPGSRRRWLIVVLSLVGLYLAYLGVTAVIRRHVDNKVHAVVGATVPEFEMLDSSGKTWTRKDLLGRKVLLSFFRSRCPSCRAEKSALQTLASESDPASTLIISMMTDRVLGYPEAETKATLAYFGYSHPVLFASKQFIAGFHGETWAHVTPISFVFDAKGTCVAALRGHQDLQTLRSAIR